MKIKVIKIVSILLLAALCLTLSSCELPISTYRATMLVRSSTPNRFNVSFGFMDGRIKQRISHTGNQDGSFSYTASLDEGEVSVYYKTPTSDAELELFTLSAGEVKEASGVGYLTNGESPTVTIKTGDGGARGCKIKIEIIH